MLTGFLHQGVAVAGPLQVLYDVDTVIFEAVHPLHLVSVDPEWMVVPLLLPAKSVPLFY